MGRGCEEGYEEELLKAIRSVKESTRHKCRAGKWDGYCYTIERVRNDPNAFRGETEIEKGNDGYFSGRIP